MLRAVRHVPLVLLLRIKVLKVVAPVLIAMLVRPCRTLVRQSAILVWLVITLSMALPFVPRALLANTRTIFSNLLAKRALAANTLLPLVSPLVTTVRLVRTLKLMAQPCVPNVLSVLLRALQDARLAMSAMQVIIPP